jgi:hypothetical protein
VVKDTDGNIYVGDVLDKNNDPFKKSIDRNTRIGANISFTLSDGVSAGIEDWEIGEEILGSAN